MATNHERVRANRAGRMGVTLAEYIAFYQVFSTRRVKLKFKRYIDPGLFSGKKDKSDERTDLH